MSVLLATRDRASLLRRTLQELSELMVEGFEWDLIVVDNGSSDETPEVLATFRELLPLRTLTVSKPGKNRALNAALPLATGDLLVFTDDDVLPAGDWLNELVAATNRWPDHGVFGGRISLEPPLGAAGWIFELPNPAVNFGRYAPLHHEGPTEDAPYGANFAVRASAMDGRRFDESIGPDGSSTYRMGSETELLRRILEEAGKCVYVPSATVRHVVRPEQLGVAAMCERSFRMGRSFGRIPPDPTVPYLFGAPRWLWRACATAAVECFFTIAASGPSYVEPRLRFHEMRGAIYEHRRKAPKNRR